RTPGAGNTVLSVEGPLNVFGQNIQCPDTNTFAPRSKIEILSLQVEDNGALFDCCCPGCFPRRTLNCDLVNGGFLRYNAANFLINNAVELHEISLVHTDVNHRVFEKDD